MSRGEIERKSARQKRKNAELIEKGLPIRGNRPFGFELDRLTIREPEAAMILAAVADVIAGTSIGAIVRRWNESGVLPTSKPRSNRAHEWNHAAVRQILQRPRNAGIHTHLSAEDRRKNKDLRERGLPPIPEKVIRTDAPQIITSDQLELVAAIIDSRAASHGVKPQRHFLTGAAECVCGTRAHGWRGLLPLRRFLSTRYRQHAHLREGRGRRAEGYRTLYGFISGGWINPAPEGRTDTAALRATIAENTAERARLSGLLATRGIDPVPIQRSFRTSRMPQRNSTSS